MNDQGSRRLRIRGKLTYANVVSSIAIFAVLAGGSAYAAGKVTSKDIAKDAVRSKQVKNGALKESDFKRGQLPQGATGAPGPQGPAGATNVVMRQGPEVTVPSSTSAVRAEATCLPGERATGGGLYNEANVGAIRMTSSYPTPNSLVAPPTGDGTTPTGWRVWMQNSNGSAGYKVNAYVICAAP